MPHRLSTSAADFMYHKCLQLHFILHHSADKVGCGEGTLVDHPWNWILFNYNFIYFSPNYNFIDLFLILYYQCYIGYFNMLWTPWYIESIIILNSKQSFKEYEMKILEFWNFTIYTISKHQIPWNKPNRRYTSPLCRKWGKHWRKLQRPKLVEWDTMFELWVNIATMAGHWIWSSDSLQCQSKSQMCRSVCVCDFKILAKAPEKEHGSPKKPWCEWALSRVQLFTTPRTIAHEAPLSMGFFPGKNTGVGCHLLLQGRLGYSCLGPLRLVFYSKPKMEAAQARGFYHAWHRPPFSHKSQGGRRALERNRKVPGKVPASASLAGQGWINLQPFEGFLRR